MSTATVAVPALACAAARNEPDAMPVLQDALLEAGEGFLADFLGGMVWCPPGTYVQGSPEDEEGRWSDEGPQRKVTLTRGFWLHRYPTTQEVWRAVMGADPSHFKGDNRPVERVNWHECMEFCQRLERMAPGFGFTPPTEAQWEYACRAGTTGPRYGPLDEVAWYHASGTTNVGGLLPNAWGLCDMLGNVDEWCLDAVRSLAPYPKGPAVDPVAGATPEGGVDPLGVADDGHSVVARGTTPPPRGTCERRTASPSRPPSTSTTSASGSPEGSARLRVIRGGSWYGYARFVRAAYRIADTPDSRYGYLGFRVAGGAPLPCFRHPAPRRQT